jgi:hypothetical protein
MAGEPIQAGNWAEASTNGMTLTRKTCVIGLLRRLRLGLRELQLPGQFAVSVSCAIKLVTIL